jgi:hypothetical protein
MKHLILILALTFSACASAPPQLSPRGKQAFYETRVIKALDLVRDTAVSANAQLPPMLSTGTMVKIVKVHQSSVRIILASNVGGWQPAVRTSLAEALMDLPPPEAAILRPYVTLVNVILDEVP